MAKGKTNQRLVVWVHPQWRGRPEIVVLREQGHSIVGMHDLPVQEPDLILHPAAHQWNDELWDYLDIAIKAARARRRKK